MDDSRGPVHTGTAGFRGARFERSDLRGAVFRDSDLRDVRITSCEVDGLHVSGFDGVVGRVVVDDVDVSAFVAGELDRRFPERVQLRGARSAADLRAAWSTVEALWRATLADAASVPEERLHERVHGEWSFVETLRHLVFAVDSWVGGVVREDPAPYHPAGLPPTDFPAEVVRGLGLDPAAPVDVAAAREALADRHGRVRGLLTEVDDDRLGEVHHVALPGDGPQDWTVEHAVRVVLREHVEHRRYAVRDLAALGLPPG